MRRLVLILGLLLAALPTLPTAAQGCGATAIRSGMTVRVRAGVNLRAAPGLNARDVGGLQIGDLVTLIGGPACASDIKWWQLGGATPGWIAESSLSTVYIEPAPATPAALHGPLEGLTVQNLTATTAPAMPADQCPPVSGTVSVNFVGATDPMVSGGEAAFFVEGGFGVPLPAICIPSAQTSGATLTAPNALVSPPRIVPVPDVTDYVRATLPEAALLQPGVWRLAAGDFTLDVRVIGPFGPFVDARQQDTTVQVLLAGFAPSEQIALLGGDINDGVATNLRVVTLTTDAHGVAGANLDGFAMPLIAAVSQSGLIALPPYIQSLDLAGAPNRTAVYDALVAALWGFEALGLPTPEPEPPTATLAPSTATPPPTLTPEPAASAVATTTADLNVPTATPTGIVNLAVTPGASTAEPTQIDTSDGCSYIVKRGDTFFRIALANGITTTQLRAANPHIINPQLIYAGNVLNIPGCGQGMP